MTRRDKIMLSNGLAQRMHELIAPLPFWHGTTLHVGIASPARAYLRRKRHKDPRKCRPYKVPHIHLHLPCDWIETVHAQGLAVVAHREGKDCHAFILAAMPVEGENPLWQVSYTARRGTRVVSGEGWVARYGGLQILADSAGMAQELLHERFLTGLTGAATPLEQAMAAAQGFIRVRKKGQV